MRSQNCLHNRTPALSPSRLHPPSSNTLHWMSATGKKFVEYSSAAEGDEAVTDRTAPVTEICECDLLGRGFCWSPRP